jgi:hypothetical protein
MSTRQLLGAYVFLNAGLFLYGALRYGVSSDISYWVCVGFNALILMLLVRGSRGAWVLSFVGASLALAYGVVLLLREDGLTPEWAFLFVVYAMQVMILFAPEVRHYMRRASYERAIGTQRGW